MTEITLERDDSNQKKHRFILWSMMVPLMCLGLYISVNLLTWAVNHRIMKVETIEASDVTAKMRERQLGCLAKNIYHEAGAEPFEGKVAVAQVTVNRAENSNFPGDICKVVYQKNQFYEKALCQFSWVCDNSSNFRPKHPDVYQESMEVAKKVLLEGFRLPSLTHALYFHADYINPGWKRQKVAHIGRHIFYK